MRSVNKVILVGNLTRDPELKQMANGQAVCTLGIATNREWINKTGDKQSLAEFHELVAFARLGEICHQFLKKGNLVYIEGYLKTRTWLTPDNIKHFRTEIVINDMIKLEKRPAGFGGAMKAEEVAEAEVGSEADAGAEAAAAFSEEVPPATETAPF